MAETVADKAAQPPPGADRAAARPPSLWAELQGLGKELPGLFSDRVELLSLELRRAGNALAQIVVLMVAAVVLGVTAWLILWTGILTLLVAVGLPMLWALVIALLINLAAVAFALLRVRKLLPSLRLPATRRHLTISPSPTAGAQPPPTSGTDEHVHATAHRHAGQPAS